MLLTSASGISLLASLGHDVVIEGGGLIVQGSSTFEGNLTVQSDTRFEQNVTVGSSAQYYADCLLAAREPASCAYDIVRIVEFSKRSKFA